MIGKSKLVTASFVLMAFGGIGIPSAAAQAPGQTTEQFYKNIQVLKGMPADLLTPSMQFMEISLGVHCVYCHDDNAAKRELDTKPQKARARGMLKMVADINKNVFAGENVVTCYTCHRGNNSPVVVLPFNDELPPALTVVTTAMGPKPTVDQLIDRYVGVLGGADNLATSASRSFKGTFANMGHIDVIHPERAPTVSNPVDMVIKGGDKRMVVQHGVGGDGINTAAGLGGWNRTAAGVFRDLRADEMSVSKLENAVFFPNQIKTVLKGLKVEGGEKIGDHSTWVLTGTAELMPSVKLYFDRDSGYLISVMWEQQSYFCCHVYREDFSDFRVVGNIRQPMTWRINGPRQTITEFHMDAVDLNNVDDAKFMRPARTVAER